MKKIKEMNAEQFIEENYFGLKIDCPRDIQTIYQALEDYAKEQLRLYGVVKSFYCYDETVQIAEETGDKIIKCDKQCEKCKQ